MRVPFGSSWGGSDSFPRASRPSGEEDELFVAHRRPSLHSGAHFPGLGARACAVMGCALPAPWMPSCVRAYMETFSSPLLASRRPLARGSCATWHLLLRVLRRAAPGMLNPHTLPWESILGLNQALLGHGASPDRHGPLP